MPVAQAIGYPPVWQHVVEISLWIVWVAVSEAVRPHFMAAAIGKDNLEFIPVR